MSSAADAQQGGCQCGAVRFEARGAPLFVANCHCHSCRKATGAAFSTWVGYKDDQVQWLTREPDYYASSPGVQRGFCSACGAPLTFAGAKWAGETHLVIGAFDHPNVFSPRSEVFTDDALPWALARKDN